MDRFIPVNEPLIGNREKELINECLDTGWISSEGEDRTQRIYQGSKDNWLEKA